VGSKIRWPYCLFIQSFRGYVNIYVLFTGCVQTIVLISVCNELIKSYSKGFKMPRNYKRKTQPKYDLDKLNCAMERIKKVLLKPLV
jgi:hypothetical protein